MKKLTAFSLLFVWLSFLPPKGRKNQRARDADRCTRHKAHDAKRTTQSSSFGNFHFDEVEAGQIYVLSVSSKRGRFTPRVISISDDVTDLVLTAIE